ncbi:hypothetical protein GCM10027290_04420 [Micromonospora sonneratiae]
MTPQAPLWRGRPEHQGLNPVGLPMRFIDESLSITPSTLGTPAGPHDCLTSDDQGHHLCPRAYVSGGRARLLGA